MRNQKWKFSLAVVTNREKSCWVGDLDGSKRYPEEGEGIGQTSEEDRRTGKRWSKTSTVISYIISAKEINNNLDAVNRSTQDDHQSSPPHVTEFTKAGATRKKRKERERKEKRTCPICNKVKLLFIKHWLP